MPRNDAKIQVAEIAFSAAHALRQVEKELHLRGDSDSHEEYWTISIHAGINKPVERELSHGRTSPGLQLTELGHEHNQLLEECSSLAGKLEAFATKVLTQGE